MILTPISVDGATLDAGIEETRADGARATGLRLSNQVSNLRFYLDFDQTGPLEIYSAHSVGHPVRATTPARDTTNPKFGASSFLWASGNGMASVVFHGMGIHPGGEGSISMWVRPSYSGTPADLRFLFDWFVQDGPVQNGRIRAFHNTDGTIRLDVYVGGSITTVTSAWSPVSGTWYHLEFAWSDTNNRIRFFVDGQIAATTTVTGAFASPDHGYFILGAQTDDTTRNWNGNIDEVEIYSTELHTAAFAPPTAAITPFSTSSPTASLAALDSGSSDSNWDMSTIDLYENFEGATVGSLKYQWKTTNSIGGGTYNGTWLTLSQLQAVTDPTGRYLYLKVQFISDGHQRVSIGDGSIQVASATAPTATLSGRITNVQATSITFTLDSYPLVNLTDWRVAYRRLSHSNDITEWSFTAATPTPTEGQTIIVSGLTESVVYQFALQGLNGSTAGNPGEIFEATPSSKANTWSGTEITEKIMTLIDNNLTAATRLGLKRVSQYGSLEDYPPARLKTANLPWVLVALQNADYTWRTMPHGYKVVYHYRIVFVNAFKTTEAVYKERVDSLGQLVSLFVDNKQLAFNAGTTSESKVAYCLPAGAEVRTPEDSILAQHGNAYAVAVNLTVETAAQA